MLPVHTYIALTLLYLVYVASPGPCFLAVSRHAIVRSRAAGLGTAVGVALGTLVWAGAAILGLGLLFGRQPWLFSAIRMVGGVYLVWIGISGIRTASRPLGRGIAPDPGGSALLAGLLASLSNPASAVFAGAVFTEVLTPPMPDWLPAALVLLVVSICLSWYIVVAVVFSTHEAVAVYARAKTLIDRIAGVAMIGFGLRLLVAVF
jgi:threonine efflux protein